MNALYKLPFPEYLKLPYMSNHGLKVFSEDPVAYLLSFNRTEDKSTPALDEGKAVHSRILEPDKYLATVACSPDVPRRSEKEKKLWVEFEAENEGKVILKPPVIEEIEFMAAAVQANPEAVNLLSDGQAEMTGTWKDQRGFMCKIRPDYTKIDDFSGVVDISDLKTFNGDLSGNLFAREITNRFYHWQKYIYTKGVCNILDIDADDIRFHFIAVSKTWPYRCRVFTIFEREMKAVGDRIEAMFDEYAMWMERPIEDWFAAEHEQELYLPPWAA